MIGHLAEETKREPVHGRRKKRQEGAWREGEEKETGSEEEWIGAGKERKVEKQPGEVGHQVADVKEIGIKKVIGGKKLEQEMMNVIYMCLEKMAQQS